MKKSLLVFLIAILVRGLSAQNVDLSNGLYFDGEPYMAIDPHNSSHIVVAWIGFTVGFPTGIKVKVSFDRGTSWSATAFVAFDTSGRSLQEIYEKGEEPHFDAMLRYQAFSRKDQIILERAFHTFFKAQKEEPRN